MLSYFISKQLTGVHQNHKYIYSSGYMILHGRPLNNYHIMQIVHGGKVSRLHDVLVICGKTFTIV